MQTCYGNSEDGIRLCQSVCSGCVIGRYSNLFRRDFQPAVRNVERHVVVRVCGAELVLGQSHHILAIVLSLHIRALGDGVGLSGTADFIRSQRCATGDADVVARHALFAAVVCLRVIMTGDGYRQVGLVDLQPAVGYTEGHVLEVGVVITELTRFEIHVVGAHIGFCHARSAARADNLGRVEQTARARSRIVRHCVWLGIVRCFKGCTGDGNCHRVRGNRLVTVCYRECHRVEIRVCIGKLVRSEVHVRCAHHCSAC